MDFPEWLGSQKAITNGTLNIFSIYICLAILIKYISKFLKKWSSLEIYNWKYTVCMSEPITSMLNLSQYLQTFYPLLLTFNSCIPLWKHFARRCCKLPVRWSGEAVGRLAHPTWQYLSACPTFVAPASVQWAPRATSLHPRTHVSTPHSSSHTTPGRNNEGFRVMFQPYWGRVEPMYTCALIRKLNI